MKTPVTAVVVVVVVAASLIGCGRTESVAQPQQPTATETTSVVAEQPAAVADGGWEVVGMSVQGRPIRIQTFGHGPRQVLFIGGIHGDESEGAFTTTQLPAAFADAGLADAVTLTIMEDANPDGRAADTRTNANGVDVNRNFPASNFDPANGGTPLSQPEAQVVHDTIGRLQPELVIVAHSWVGDQFINFDGPAEAPAARFSELSGLPVQASSGFAPTPGSLGSCFGRDRGIAILTIEVLRGSDPQAVWEKLRPALIDVIGS